MISPGMLLSERYEIIDRVGSGGMADVYKARDQRLNRFVTIPLQTAPPLEIWRQTLHHYYIPVLRS